MTIQERIKASQERVKALKKVLQSTADALVVEATHLTNLKKESESNNT